MSLSCCVCVYLLLLLLSVLVAVVVVVIVFVVVCVVVDQLSLFNITFVPVVVIIGDFSTTKRLMANITSSSSSSSSFELTATTSCGGAGAGADGGHQPPPQQQQTVLYPMVNENDTPLPRHWSPKDRCNYLGLAQNNLRVLYKGLSTASLLSFDRHFDIVFFSFIHCVFHRVSDR